MMSFRNRAKREGDANRHAAKAGGFTLIETAIAMVVMMVVGLGATSLFLYSIHNNSGGSMRSDALAIAQQQAEELRSVGFNDEKLALGERSTTVVLQNVTAADSAPSSGGGVSSYSASAAGSTISASGKPGKGGGGGGGGGGGSEDEDEDEDEDEGGEGGEDGGKYKVLVNVEGLPAGATAPTQKRITLRVTPENTFGANSWVNQNPVVIVILRSSPAAGPYSQ